MEHLNTLIISILLAGVIVLFPTLNKVETPKKILSSSTITHNSKISKPAISPNISNLWLYLSSIDLSEGNSLVNFESFGDAASLSLQVVNNIVILDLPEKHESFVSPPNKDRIVLKTPKYWEIVHSIESKQGKKMYRPKNKDRSCKNTNAPCGHYQISAQALVDIGCTTDQCKMDRENLKHSLTMSQTLEKINLGRLANKGYSHLPDYQKYLIHQQGATGIRNILEAQAGRHNFTKRSIKNMANNSSLSYKTLKNSGSQLAANKFLNYWENKWEAEIELIFAAQYKQQMAIREHLLIASNMTL